MHRCSWPLGCWARVGLAVWCRPDGCPLVSRPPTLTAACLPLAGAGFIRLRSSLDRGLRSRLGSAVSCERRFRPVALCFVGVASLSPWFFTVPPFVCPAQLHIRCGSVPVICSCMLSCLLSVPSAGSSCACALLGESHWNML